MYSSLEIVNLFYVVTKEIFFGVSNKSTKVKVGYSFSVAVAFSLQSIH